MYINVITKKLNHTKFEFLIKLLIIEKYRLSVILKMIQDNLKY